MAGSGSFKVYAVSDGAEKEWSVTPFGDHWSVHDEDPVGADETDFVDVTVINKEDRYNLSELMPAVAKTITGIRYGLRCTGRDSSVDCSFRMFDSSNVEITEFLKKCDIRTTPSPGDVWKTRYFDILGQSVARARFTGSIKSLLKSITGGTGDTASG